MMSMEAYKAQSRKRSAEEDLDCVIVPKARSEHDYSDDDSKSGSPSMDDDRRAHHNELERRRRDHIKDHFMSLKDAIPLLEGEKSSRALILKRAVEYISLMGSRMQDLQRRNELLEAKLRERGEELPAPVATVPRPAVYKPTPVMSAPSTSTSPVMPTGLNSPFKPTYVPATVSAPVVSAPMTTSVTSFPGMRLPVLSQQEQLLALTQALMQAKLAALQAPQPSPPTRPEDIQSRLLGASMVAARY